MPSPLISQEQHTTLLQRPDSTVEAVSSNDGNADGAPRPSASVVGGDDESTTIAQAYVWSNLWKMYLAIEVRIVGIFKPQNGTATAQGDSEEGERASKNSHNDLRDSSRKAGEKPTIPQGENTGVSGNTSTPPLNNSFDVRSTPNLPDSANAAPTPDSPFPPTPAYQQDCTFELTIGTSSSSNSTDAASTNAASTNMASTANPIYQIGCNVAPNISVNAAMANPIYQMGCNFTPNISVPLSYSSANAAESTTNSFFYPPTPTTYQTGSKFKFASTTV